MHDYGHYCSLSWSLSFFLLAFILYWVWSLLVHPTTKNQNANCVHHTYLYVVFHRQSKRRGGGNQSHAQAGSAPQKIRGGQGLERTARQKPLRTRKRADQIRLFTPILEQQFAQHRKEEQRQYLVEEQQTSHNTIENRFLKYALGIIEERYKALANRILTELNLPISDEEKGRIAKTKEELLHLTRHPFFRNVGKFEGLKQESLILQRDVNYSKIFRTSVILRKSFNLNDGMYRMETKDIATLYEIWCFIQVEKVVKELFAENGAEVTLEHANRMEMSSFFTRELGKGEHSRIVFKQGEVTLAELVYNPRHDDKTDDVRGIGDLESPTVPQKPDIVLQLSKDDLQRGMNMTYLLPMKRPTENMMRLFWP